MWRFSCLSLSIFPTDHHRNHHQGEEQRVYGSTNILAVMMGEEEGDGEGGRGEGEEVRGILRNTNDQPRQRTPGDISEDNQVHFNM